ncbi:type II toxin-antitoxin system Phd/YefM family antitoxin [Streptomyces rubiginosohelvolus]|uniref:type II toxin-antitoxin system Phd/YefM family antitoxin n=1 Tax=Streptomyces rubiginosohelvolus TaxID=67362 RepID=UPI003796762B
MEMTAHEFTHRSAQVLAMAERGETITVTMNGTVVARVVPISNDDALPYPTDPMGAIQLPDLGLPDLTDNELKP